MKPPNHFVQICAAAETHQADILRGVVGLLSNPRCAILNAVEDSSPYHQVLEFQAGQSLSIQ